MPAPAAAGAQEKGEITLPVASSLSSGPAVTVVLTAVLASAVSPFCLHVKRPSAPGVVALMARITVSVVNPVGVGTFDM